MADSTSLLTAPKYLTIAQDLKEKIQQKVYPVGDFLPSENELVKIYSVSRPTVRAAIAKLRDMGLVDVAHGKGTRVTDSKILQQLGSILKFTDVIQAQGHQPGTRVTESREVRATTDIAKLLGVAVNSPVFKISRLHTADDLVISYHISYLRAEVVILKDRLEEILSLYRYMEQVYHIFILYTDDTISAEAATPTIARLLKIKPGEPVLRFDRLAYSTEQQVVEAAFSFARSDRFKYKERVYGKGTK